MIDTARCTGADFCEELSGSADTSFARFYQGNPPSRVVYSSGHFALLADMSPLTTGHLLLLPVRHYLSFAQVLGVHTTEAVDLINRVTALYTETFQTPLIMEHGSSGGQESHACITHAHLHFLPADGGIVDRFLIDDELAYRELDSITELSQAPWPHSAYFLRIYGDSCRVYLPTTAQKRQYLRSAAGEALAIKDPEWDYAVVMRMTELRSTMNMVGHWSDVLNRTALNTEVTGGE